MLGNQTLTRFAVGSLGTAICAAICLVGATAPAAAQEVRSTEVRFGDLNLARPEGRAVLDQRLRRAAYKVCSTMGRSPAEIADERQCVAEALGRVQLPARAMVPLNPDAG